MHKSSYSNDRHNNYQEVQSTIITTTWTQTGCYIHPQWGEQPLFTQTWSGPKGTVQASRMVFCTDEPDVTEELYWTVVQTLEGAYHCCFTGFSNWL